MKIIDVNTGQELRVGVPFDNVHGRQVLTRVWVGFTKGEATVKYLDPPSSYGLKHAEVRVPLVVRYTHPGFFLQKVAFLPS